MPLLIPDIIERLEYLNTTNSDLVKRIRSYTTLIEALRELDALIEMTRAKESVCLQLEYILLKLSLGNVESIFDDQMLHTVISGPPGVGKTQLGKALSKIWHALGLLKGTPKSSKKGSEDYGKLEKRLTDTNTRLVTVLRSNFSIIDGLVANKNVDESVVGLCAVQEYLLTTIKENTIERDPDSVKSDEPVPFRIVSRVDFVAGYLGQTAIKTKKILEECLGGVLFIDEAYSLVHDDRDAFGMEALTTLNLFMSDHPNEIIVIFAGYDELLEKTIFKRQPGLRRRCSWFFSIEPYTAEGLTDIFKQQLAKVSWQIAETIDIVAFFRKNIKYFTNYGGDTLKFAFYCKLYQMDSEFIEITDPSQKSPRGKKRKLAPTPSPTQCITEDTLELALEKYRKNRIEKEPESQPHSMMYS